MLVARVGQWLCALPAADFIETMRPLPVEPLPGTPSFVRGLARIRGTATPVVDLAERLTERAGGAARRFATLRLGERVVALAVDDVLGVRWVATDTLDETPALLGELSREVVDAVAALDEDLLLLLRGARLLPEDAWRRVAEAVVGAPR